MSSHTSDSVWDMGALSMGFVPATHVSDPATIPLSKILVGAGDGDTYRSIRSIYYSVGADIANNLMSAEPNISITNGVAVFDIEQIGNIGCGDMVTYGSGLKCFLNYKIDRFRWTVVTNQGYSVPRGSGAVISIRRCFASVDAAIGSIDNDGIHCRVDGVTAAAFMNFRDLVTAGVRLSIMCYHSTGSSPDETSSIVVPGDATYGFITSGNNNIAIEAPYRIGEATSGDRFVRANTPQHGNGLPGTGYQIRGSNGADDVILFKNCCGIVNGLELYGATTNGLRFSMTQDIDGSVNVRCKSCIVHNSGEYGIVFEATAPASIDNASSWANIVYGQTVANILKGNRVQSSLYVYQNTLDKGADDGDVIGIKYTDTSSFIYCGFNAFVGGRAEKDISGTGNVIDGGIHYNIGNDARFSRNILWTNRTWVQAQLSDASTYDNVFVDRLGHNYNIKDMNSPLYNYGTVDYVDWRRYPGAGQSEEAMGVDLSGRILPDYELSIGALGYSQIFEFSGSDILDVFEKSMRFISPYDDNWDANPYGDGRVEGQMVADARTFYRIPATIAIMGATTSEEFVKENKIFICLSKVGGAISNRRMRLVGEFEAYIELMNKMLVVRKDMAAGNALFSNLAGDKNYIFRYDEQAQKLSIYKGIPTRTGATV